MPYVCLMKVNMFWLHSLILQISMYTIDVFCRNDKKKIQAKNSLIKIKYRLYSIRRNIHVHVSLVYFIHSIMLMLHFCIFQGVSGTCIFKRLQSYFNDHYRFLVWRKSLLNLNRNFLDISGRARKNTCFRALTETPERLWLVGYII